MSALPHDNTLPHWLRIEADASEELDASNSSIQVMRDAASLIEHLLNPWQLIAEKPPEYGRILLFYAITDPEPARDGKPKNWKKATGCLMHGYTGEPDYYLWDGRKLASYEIPPTHWAELPEGPK